MHKYVAIILNQVENFDNFFNIEFLSYEKDDFSTWFASFNWKFKIQAHIVFQHITEFLDIVNGDENLPPVGKIFFKSKFGEKAQRYENYNMIKRIMIFRN